MKFNSEELQNALNKNVPFSEKHKNTIMDKINVQQEFSIKKRKKNNFIKMVNVAMSGTLLFAIMFGLSYFIGKETGLISTDNKVVQKAANDDNDNSEKGEDPSEKTPPTKTDDEDEPKKVEEIDENIVLLKGFKGTVTKAEQLPAMSIISEENWKKAKEKFQYQSEEITNLQLSNFEVGEAYNGKVNDETFEIRLFTKDEFLIIVSKYGERETVILKQDFNYRPWLFFDDSIIFQQFVKREGIEFNLQTQSFGNGTFNGGNSAELNDLENLFYETIINNLSKDRMIGEEYEVEKYHMRYLDKQVLVLERNSIYQSAIVNGYSYEDGKLQLEITYADFISDENEPNGFQLDFSKNVTRTITIKEGTTMELIMEVTDDVKFTNVNWEDVSGINFNGRFIFFTFEDGEVVSMKQKYIP
jgi:hypothetical protein